MIELNDEYGLKQLCQQSHLPLKVLQNTIAYQRFLQNKSKKNHDSSISRVETFKKSSNSFHKEQIVIRQQGKDNTQEKIYQKLINEETKGRIMDQDQQLEELDKIQSQSIENSHKNNTGQKRSLNKNKNSLDQLENKLKETQLDNKETINKKASKAKPKSTQERSSKSINNLIKRALIFANEYKWLAIKKENEKLVAGYCKYCYEKDVTFVQFSKRKLDCHQLTKHHQKIQNDKENKKIQEMIFNQQNYFVCRIYQCDEKFEDEQQRTEHEMKKHEIGLDQN